MKVLASICCFILWVCFSILKIYGQDLTGTWKGEIHMNNSIGYMESDIIKTGNNTYSGVNYIQWRNAGDNTPLSDPSIRKVKKLFHAEFTRNMLNEKEYDTIQMIPGTHFQLSGGEYIFSNENGQDKLVYSTQYIQTLLTRVSTAFPEQYKPFLLINTTSKENVQKNENIDKSNFTLMTSPGQLLRVKINFDSATQDNWKYEASGTIKIQNNKNVIGSLFISNDYAGNEFRTLYHNQWKTEVEGTCDSTGKVLSLQLLYEKEPWAVCSMTLGETSIKGTSTIELKPGRLSTTVSGIFHRSEYNSPVFLKSNQNERFVGSWKLKILAGSPVPQIFTNKYLEIFTDGFGISRNDKNNSISNVRVVDWKVIDNSHITISGKLYTYVFNNDHTIITLKNDHSSIDPKETIFNMALQRMSATPANEFTNSFDTTNMGNWVISARISHSTMYLSSDNLYDPENIFCDIHAFTPSLGEIISYSLPLFSSLPFDSLTFIKYQFQEGNISLQGLNRDTSTDYLSYCSKGIIILHNDNETLILTKNGDIKWFDLASLHLQYDQHFNYYARTLGPPHSHWATCTLCRGSGKAPTYNGMRVCSACSGKGGHFFDDISGEEY